jgi:hypothetical protein
MPVQTPHADYAYRKADWAKIRAFAEGARAVKALGAAYLPKPTGWTEAEYNAYKERAEVYGAIDRTIDGFDGAIFRRPPQVELPSDEAEKLAADITLTGKTLTEWLRDTVREILGPGRRGVLVDFTAGTQDDNASNPQASRFANGQQRPYVVPYTAEQIINWDTETVGGVTRLSLVVLEEKNAIPSSIDPFLKEIQTRYRVLRLTDGVYVQELWTATTVPAPVTQAPNVAGQQAAATEVSYVKTAEVKPLRRGAPLNAIPFFFIGPSGQSITPEKPPLLDVADLNAIHYMTSADYAHGLHWVGLPTPWVTGAREKEKIAIGPSTAIVLEDPQAKVGMLEFTGTGLNAVKERLEGLERKMAALGARILEERETQAESGEAVRMRQAGDASVLAGISDAVSRACEAIVARLLWWAGTDADEPEVTIEINTEFFGQRMDPQTLVALIQARQAGEISRETFLWNLQKGEMLQEGRTIEDEMAKIETEAPVMPSGGGAAAAAAGGAA